MTSPPRSPLLLLCGYAVLYSIALIYTSTKCDMPAAPPPPLVPSIPPRGRGRGIEHERGAERGPWLAGSLESRAS